MMKNRCFKHLGTHFIENYNKSIKLEENAEIYTILNNSVPSQLPISNKIIISNRYGQIEAIYPMMCTSHLKIGDYLSI